VFIELVEWLRCVREHELTWLVARTDAMEGRDIVRGVLGCPVCRAIYPIADGVADLRDGAAAAPPAPADAAPDEALRAAALLGLTTPGGFVALAGEWGRAAAAIVAIAPEVHVLALDPPSSLASGGGLSLALAGDDVPLRPESARGIALDASHATPRRLAAAAGALRAGGRLVAPADAPVPAGITLLARDERDWVGERDPAPAVSRLEVARRKER
jgi:hypothetical protein